ncbi:amidohydrolase [Rubritalea tangerina]|uniref:Amidohydrolase n=2 Tax=Rubritalea tangerina TaxID=430798 RepID=A0ABW4ZAA6_9BACT
MKAPLSSSLLSLLLSAPFLPAETSSLQEMGKIATASPTTDIYLADQFITMDPKRPNAKAVAIRNGKFIDIGTLDEVKKAAGPKAKIINDYADKTIIAGLIEQHVHPVLAALTMSTHVISIEDWDTIDGFSPAVRDPKNYQQRLKTAIAEHQKNSPKDPFISWGYHHYMHGKNLNRTSLDQLSSTFPIIIWHRSCHEFFLNSKALELASIDQSTIDTMSKSAQSQSDLSKGHFYEQGALAILSKLAPIMASPVTFKKGLEYTEKYYHQNGVTICCEPGGFFSKEMQEAINDVYSDDDTPFIHYFIGDGKSFVARNPNDPAAMVKDTEQILTWGKGKTRYLPNQIKLLLDGAIYSQLMQMKDGYTDGHKGAWIMDPPVFDYAFQSYWDAGYQIHTHNNGDAGMDTYLKSLEKAMQRTPRKDHRSVLVHFGFAQPQQVKRLGELGGIVSANPYYVTALAGKYKTMGIGPERSKNMVPLGEVIKNNISLSFHSDMPMAPAKPLQLAWAGVNRMTFEGSVEGPEHCAPLDVALKAITIDAAYSLQLENEIGSIEVGKNANLTVLDKNPYKVDPMKLKDINVLATVLEGRHFPVPKTTKKLSSNILFGPSPFVALQLPQHDPLNLNSHRLHGSPHCSCKTNQKLAEAMFPPQ